MSTAEQPAPDGAHVTTTPTAAAPAPATGIQSAESGERIALPPPKAAPPPVNPATLLRRARGLDAILVGVLLIFAFAAASFRAANSDLFMHLATGRLIVQGAFSFGEDPFTFASEGRWVEHAWLFDLIVYGIYRLPRVGPEALVVAKALLMAGLAWLLFRAGSLPGRRTWISAACALLAILALSPRVLLQPVVVSYFLLGLTLYLLYTSPPNSRRLWALPAVCLVWVNMDAWFLLGPITIALYLLGEVIDPLLSPPKPGEPVPNKDHVRSLGLVLAASVAACVINPYHIYVLNLPWLLTDSGTALAQEPQFRSFFLSPFVNYKAYLQDNIGLSVAGMAYPVLLLGSLASFGLLAVYAADRLRAGRALIWLALGLLAAYNIRLIPFFAIVAGPIMALNYLDLAERLFGADLRTERGWRRWGVAGRVLTILAGIALILGSVGGYVQAQPYHARKVGWGVEVDEGLKGAALQVAAWRAEEALPKERHWFNLAPEVVNYFAWFCPGERGFLDQRVGLFRGAAGQDFATVRGSLDGLDLPRDKPPPWREVLARRQAQFVVLHLYDLNRQGVMLQRLYGNPEEFVPCYVKGKTAIFAWRGPALQPGTPRPEVDARLTRDFGREAFGKDAVPLPDDLAAAPPKEAWWRVLVEPPGAASPSGWQAVQHFTRFDAMGPTFRNRHQEEWLAFMATGLAGLGAQPGGPTLPGTLIMVRMNRMYGHLYNMPLLRFDRKTGKPEGNDPFSIFDELSFRLLNSYAQAQDSGPVDSLYLAVRLARLGLAESREDARTCLVLAEAYSRLSTRTRERARIGTVVPTEKEGPRYQVFYPHVERIRQAQVAAALNQVFKLNPPARIKQVAHLLLLDVYRAPQFLELQVKHFREFLTLCRALKYVPNVTPEKAQEEVEQLANVLKQLEQGLKTRQEQYILKSAGKPVLQQAQAAMENGLPETALKLLMEAKPDDLMAPGSGGVSVGAYMAVELLLAVGRVDEAREALVPEPGKEKDFNRRVFGTNDLGLPAYEWFRVVLGAATGDYKSVDQFLEECERSTEEVQGASAMFQILEFTTGPLPGDADGQGKISLAEFAGHLIGHVLLREAPAATMPWQWGRFANIRPRVAQVKEVPFRFWQGGLEQCVVMLNGLLQKRADLVTLRAWLALEQGQTEKARELALKALRLGDRGREGDRHYIQPYPSRGLASLVVDLTDRVGKRRQAKK